MGHDPAQDAVLFDALPRGLGVAHGVPAARVQQAVVAARSAVGQVVPLDERDAQPAQRQVERRAAARRAAADHQDIVFVVHSSPSRPKLLTSHSLILSQCIDRSTALHQPR